MSEKFSKLSIELINEIVYKRSQLWSQMIEKFTKSNDSTNEGLNLEEIESHYFDENTEGSSTVEEAIESDVEENINVLQDVTNMVENYTNNGISIIDNNVSTIYGDTKNSEIQNLLNETKAIVDEQYRRWQVAGIEPILKTFDKHKIEQKVGDWMKRNQGVKRKLKDTNCVNSSLEKGRNRKFCYDDDSDSESLQSIDTARYIRSSRKNCALTSATKTTIKTNCKVKNHRRSCDLRGNYATVCLESNKQNCHDARKRRHGYFMEHDQHKNRIRRKNRKTALCCNAYRCHHGRHLHTVSTSPSSASLSSSFSMTPIKNCEKFDKYGHKSQREKYAWKSPQEDICCLSTTKFVRKHCLSQCKTKSNHESLQMKMAQVSFSREKLKREFDLKPLKAVSTNKRDRSKNTITVEISDSSQDEENNQELQGTLKLSKKMYKKDDLTVKSPESTFFTDANQMCRNSTKLEDKTMKKSSKITIDHSETDSDRYLVSSTTIRANENNSKGILLYKPQNKTAPAEFTFTEDILCQKIGNKHAQKFFKYYTGKRCFDGTKSVYFRPSKQFLEDSADTTGSDSDPFEMFGTYGDLHECIE